MKKSSLITSFFLLVLIVACSNRDQNGSQKAAKNEISQSITQQFDAGGSAPIDLSIVGPDSWNRVCVIGPYSNNQTAEKVLGFKWDLEKNSSVDDLNDGVNLLVFVQNQEVVAFTDHIRNKGDFVDVVGSCFDRKQAKFDRQVGQDGWVKLIKPMPK